MAALVNYYDVYDLDKSQTAAEIRKVLFKKIDKTLKLINKFVQQSNRDKIKEYEQQKIEMEDIRQKIFKNDKTKAQYDLELSRLYQGQAVVIYESDIDREKYDALKMRIEALYALLHKSTIGAPQWESAVIEARKIIDIDSTKPEPYFVLATAQYELGNYNDAIDACDIGVSSCVDNLSLRRIQVHYNILCERYQQAQQYINQAVKDNLDTSYFYAKQVFLYFYAQRNDLAVNTIKEYLVQNPNDTAYREIVSNDLLYMARSCYVSDGDDNIFIIDKESYVHCLNLVTMANQIYDSEYNHSELTRIRGEGEILYSEDRLLTQIAYGFIGVIMLYFGVVEHGARELTVVGAFFVGLVYIVRRYNYRPVWQIHRDEYRGFREKEDNIIYNLAMIPSTIIEEMVKLLRA